MAARENGYCTSFILMSAQLEWERIRGNEPLSPFQFTVGGKGLGLGLGFLGGLEDCGLSVPPGGYWAGALLPPGVYWGTFLVFFFLIWQCMKLATKEATTRTPENRQGRNENRQESMREINLFQLRWSEIKTTQ